MNEKVPTARMRLACMHCRVTWPDDAVLEAIQLHFQVDHDTDKIELALVSICNQCLGEMKYYRVEPTGGGWWMYHRCEACDLVGRVKTTKKPKDPEI